MCPKDALALLAQPIPPGLLPPWLHSRASLQLPVPCTRCCCLQLCPDWRKPRKNANKTFIFSGSQFSCSPVGQPRTYTEMLQQSPRFLLILLKVYLIVQLVPVPSYACSWNQDKVFLLLGLLQAEHVTIIFNFFCQALSALQLQWDKVTLTFYSVLPGLLTPSLQVPGRAAAFPSLLLELEWDLPGLWVSCAADTVYQHSAN